MKTDFRPAIRRALAASCRFVLFRRSGSRPGCNHEVKFPGICRDAVLLGVTRLKKKASRGRPSKFPGICRDAISLGVNRRTLYRALVGEWKLPKLLARYKKLKGVRA